MIGERAYIQEATYWSSPVQGGFGDITFSAPITLRTRWEDKTEQFVNQEGNEQVSRSIVWALQDLDVGGYLFKGTSVASDPTVLEGALRIERFDKIPDLRGLNVERKAFL